MQKIATTRVADLRLPVIIVWGVEAMPGRKADAAWQINGDYLGEGRTLRSETRGDSFRMLTDVADDISASRMVHFAEKIL